MLEHIYSEGQQPMLEHGKSGRRRKQEKTSPLQVELVELEMKE